MGRVRGGAYAARAVILLVGLWVDCLVETPDIDIGDPRLNIGVGRDDEQQNQGLEEVAMEMGLLE